MLETNLAWVIPALLAPAIWAIVNLIDDNLVRYVYKGAHIGSIISGFFALFPILLIFFFKDINLYIDPSMAAIAFGAGFLNVVYYFFYFRALAKEHPSIVVALFCLTPALIPLIAYWLLGERLTLTAIAGFIIVILSSVIYSLSDIRKFKVSSAFWTVLIAALILDVVAVANKYVYDRTDFFSAYIYFSLGMVAAGLYFLYVLLFQRNGAMLKQIFKKNSYKGLSLLALVELLGITAEYTRNYALNLGPLSLVKAFENTQVIYVLIISAILYPLAPKYFPEAKAPFMKLKLMMGALMICGVYISTL